MTNVCLQGCVGCATCPSGTYKVGGCNASYLDVVCSECSPECGPGMVETSACGENAQDRECSVCKGCPSGTYISPIPGTCNTTQSTCLPCIGTCPAGQFLNSTCPENGHSTMDISSCATCRTTCGEGRYMNSTCQGGPSTKDTVQCADCDSCPLYEYVSSPCIGNDTNPITGRKCSPCKACEAGEYIASGSTCSDTYTDCRQCNACAETASSFAETPCDGRGISPNQGCISCLEHRNGVGCGVGFFLTRQQNKCECVACMPYGCNIGEYIFGCPGDGVSADSAACRACENCPEGSYLLIPCDGFGSDPILGRTCAPCNCQNGDYRPGKLSLSPSLYFSKQNLIVFLD